MRELTVEDVASVAGGEDGYGGPCAMSGADVLILAGLSVVMGLSWAVSGPIAGVGATLAFASHVNTVMNQEAMCMANYSY